MARAYIGFGGNIGDTRQLITDAIVCLAQRCELQIMAKSCFYQSAPVDALGGDYINAVIEIETQLTPYGLLHICQAVEQGTTDTVPCSDRIHDSWIHRQLAIGSCFYG